MEIQELVLYHVHRNNFYTDKWRIGNIIETPLIGYNYFYQGLINDPHNQISINMTNNDQIKYLSENLDKFRETECSTISKMTKVELIDYSSHLLSLLDITFESLLGSRKVARELIFEEKRLKINPSLPSRLRCIWLSSLNEIEKWYTDFIHSPNKGIFKVKATGNFFKTDGSHIKLDILKLSDFDIAAEKYWKGLDNDKENPQPEILFEGKIEILEQYQNPSEI